MIEIKAEFESKNKPILVWVLGILVNLIGVLVWSHNSLPAFFAALLAVGAGIIVGENMKDRDGDKDDALDEKTRLD